MKGWLYCENPHANVRITLLLSGIFYCHVTAICRDGPCMVGGTYTWVDHFKKTRGILEISDNMHPHPDSFVWQLVLSLSILRILSYFAFLKGIEWQGKVKDKRHFDLSGTCVPWPSPLQHFLSWFSLFFSFGCNRRRDRWHNLFPVIKPPFFQIFQALELVIFCNSVYTNHSGVLLWPCIGDGHISWEVCTTSSTTTVTGMSFISLSSSLLGTI